MCKNSIRGQNVEFNVTLQRRPIVVLIWHIRVKIVRFCSLTWRVKTHLCGHSSISIGFSEMSVLFVCLFFTQNQFNELDETNWLPHRFLFFFSLLFAQVQFNNDRSTGGSVLLQGKSIYEEQANVKALPLILCITQQQRARNIKSES